MRPPLNRIIAVMQEMRRDEELKTVKYAGGTHRFEIPHPKSCGAGRTRS